MFQLHALQPYKVQRFFAIGYARVGSFVDGIEFLELAKTDPKTIHERVINQKKLADFKAFLNKLD